MEDANDLDGERQSERGVEVMVPPFMGLVLVGVVADGLVTGVKGGWFSVFK